MRAAVVRHLYHNAERLSFLNEHRLIQFERMISGQVLRYVCHDRGRSGSRIFKVGQVCIDCYLVISFSLDGICAYLGNFDIIIHALTDIRHIRRHTLRIGQVSLDIIPRRDIISRRKCVI